MSTLIWLIASPVYFTISLGAGVDPLTGLLCAWIGVMTAIGSAQSFLPKPCISKETPANVSLEEAPQRFTTTKPVA